MIVVDALTYRYPGAARDALHAVSLQIAEGSFTAIIGGNGSGKSTLACCLNGLLRPTVGRVLVDGLDTTDDVCLAAIRRRVGLVFQDPNLQMTSPTIERELGFGLQNTALPTPEIQQRVREELLRLQLEHRRRDPPSSLSGGEKQRLALACVMMLRPRYLVLDEPTTFLSSASRRRLMTELETLYRHEKTALVLITQYFEEALRADRVIVFNKGNVMFDGDLGHLRRERSILHASGVLLSGEAR